MHYSKTIYLLLILHILAGCGTTRMINELQAEAETAFERGNFPEALSCYEELIRTKKLNGHKVNGITYYKAGISAWETGNAGKTAEYLGLAGRDDVSDEKSLIILSQAYREIDNLSLEITTLEKYIASYPEGLRINDMRTRLFNTYVESGNNELAMELWPDLKGLSPNHPELLGNFFLLNRRLGKEEELKKIAVQLYSTDSSNVTALEYLGEHYFWKAENRYQQEMTAYEKNRTGRQYRQLLDALETINEQFRLSRDFFERLFDIKPDTRYAAYMGNIYLRFGNKEKATYYQQKAGQTE